MLIRPARPDDFDDWFALFESVAAEARWIGAEAPMSRAEREETFSRLLDAAGSEIFVAEVGGAPVGALTAEMTAGIVRFGMFVATGSRGTGVGRRLLDACLAWSREWGAHKVTLHVWPHNGPAIALYRRAGFVVEGRLRRHWRRRSGQLWDSLQMGLVLDETSPGSSYPDAGAAAEPTGERGQPA